MGNRAIITTREDYDNDALGIYLHWNGGRDSVEAFLAYCDLRNDRSPEDDEYGYARLVQVIGNYFGGTLSVGIINGAQGDYGDNGTYIVERWQIVGREHFEGGIEQRDYDLLDMMLAIDEAQPEREQLGADLIGAYVLERLHPLAYEEKLELLEIGSEVIVNNFDGWHKYTVIDFGEPDAVVNGHDVGGVPLFNFTHWYDKEYQAAWKLDPTKPEDLEKLRTNPNSYLLPHTRFYLPSSPDNTKRVQRTLLDLI